MNTLKKKSTKSAKLPKPIKVKKEKSEGDDALHPMSHYINDRIELIKQIFSTLKPKTITNLAPDYLKNNNLEEIEEFCLNELLGISTKRLLSIINATKCPTDTESSSDSDVNNIEEHISLEEISSDSEVEKSSAKTKFSSKAIDKDGKINVLELLELQARARAIRSQLALEPVTKIDVDSDDEANTTQLKKPERKVNQKHSDVEKTKKSSLSSHSKSNGSAKSDTFKSTIAPIRSPKPQIEEVTRQKIKLKRNFRKRSQECKNVEISPHVPQHTSDVLKESEVKEERRSQSPDVIQIVTETETLYISDSSSDEMPAKHKIQEISNSVNANVEMLKIDASGNANRLNDNVDIPRQQSETEDGEITDDDEATVEKENNVSNREDSSDQKQTLQSESQLANTDEAIPSVGYKEIVDVAATAERADDKHNNSLQINDDAITSTEAVTYAETESLSLKEKTEQSAVTIINIEIIENKLPDKCKEGIHADDNDEDNDHNDDVISIEGGDLESEMTEHLENDAKTKDSTVLAAIKEEKNDVITLDDSSDEEFKEEVNSKHSESWNARWLKSSKVSKVLATSRLGNRVRDKIKKSKRSQEISLEMKRQEGEVANKSSCPLPVSSKHEDGSVEQYKELLEMRQK